MPRAAQNSATKRIIRSGPIPSAGVIVQLLQYREHQLALREPVKVLPRIAGLAERGMMPKVCTTQTVGANNVWCDSLVPDASECRPAPLVPNSVGRRYSFQRAIGFVRR